MDDEIDFKTRGRRGYSWIWYHIYVTAVKAMEDRMMGEVNGSYYKM